MNTYRLIISTPDGTIFDENVEGIMLRGANGDLAVLAGHAPFMTSVQKGECKVTTDGGDERLADIDGGILSVDKEKVTLLSGSFNWK